MTGGSFLVRPHTAFRESYLDALREAFGMGSGPPRAADAIGAIAADFETHLAALDRDGQTSHEEAGRTLPGVPSNSFWLVDGSRFIGSISIRARIDTHVLARFGGHIGYGIRPSMRRKGYGTRQLALALQICRGMGIGTVRIGCAVDNTGSRRVIEANGGILLRRCEPAWYVDEPYLLFEIIVV
jgi:predicted acetyltransferase